MTRLKLSEIAMYRITLLKYKCLITDKNECKGFGYAMLTSHKRKFSAQPAAYHARIIYGIARGAPNHMVNTMVFLWCTAVCFIESLETF